MGLLKEGGAAELGGPVPSAKLEIPVPANGTEKQTPGAALGEGRTDVEGETENPGVGEGVGVDEGEGMGKGGHTTSFR